MYFSAWLILPLGPIIGSWLGVLIQHWPPVHRDLWRRSACPSCARQLRPAELIPIVSFLALRGRCCGCGAWIGWFALGIELAALTVGAAAFLVDGNTVQAWIDAGLGWALLLAAWIDAESLLLPDVITLPLILMGLVVTAWFDPSALYSHAAATGLAYLGFVLLNAAYRAMRHRDGLGEGDAKLLAAAGAWLGAAALPDVILAAGIIGLLIALTLNVAGQRVGPAQKLPFGPALALAFFGLRLAHAAYT